jgi:hypothetical protein
MRALSGNRLAWGLAGLVLGLTAAGLAIAVLPAPAPAHGADLVRFDLPSPEGTTFGARPADPQAAVSPDGRQIATVPMAKDYTRRIWLHTLDSAARPLANTEDARFPFWAPQGNWIGFFAHGKLKKVRTSGGPPEVLCDAAETYGATWSASGVVLFAPNRTGGLYSVPASGGPATPSDTRRSTT